MSADGTRPIANDPAFMVDYVKVRPFFDTAYVILGKDDIRTAEIPDVIVSISDAARAAYAGMTAQQVEQMSRYRDQGDAKGQANAPPVPDSDSAD